MGRGKLPDKVRVPSESPDVTIGLRIHVEPPTFRLGSDDELSVVLTAKVLSSLQPTSEVMLATFLSPFYSLKRGSYTNIVRLDDVVRNSIKPHPRVPGLIAAEGPFTAAPDTTITNVDMKSLKFIHLYPPRPDHHYAGPPPDLKKYFDFIIVPPLGQGSVSTHLSLPKTYLEEAHMEAGEQYIVSLTDHWLGTSWWGYGTFEGKRLRFWESPERRRSNEEAIAEFQENLRLFFEPPLEGLDADPGSWEMGEKPKMLAMVIEDEGRAGVATFDVV